jgi:hypothetical protein
MMDVYIEGSELNEPPAPEPVSVPAGTPEQQIATLQQQLSGMDRHDMSRGSVLDRLEELYKQLGEPETQEVQDEPDQADQPDEAPMDLETATNEVTQTVDALEREWGESFSQNLVTAQSAVAALSQELGTDVADIIDAAGIGNNLIVLRTFYELGKGGSAPVIRQTEAAHLIQALQQTDAYKRSGPAHELLVNVIQDLYQITNP